MSLQDTIQAAVKTDKVIVGFRKSIKFIKINSPKLIVVANNTPEKMRKEIEHNAKISGIKIEIFPGSSKEFGIFCGKPYPVSTLVIKG